MRCPTIIGRTAELATLHGLVDAAARGQGSTCFLIGEAGVGKSRLAAAVVEYASAAGLRVLRGRAVDGPHPVTFRPLTEAFLAALRDGPLPDLEGFGPAVERLLPWRSAEDLHWADPETLAVLIEQAMIAEDAFNQTSLGPYTVSTLRRLAALNPRTLAVMHGSSYAGDGAAALNALADSYLDRLTASLKETL